MDRAKRGSRGFVGRLTGLRGATGLRANANAAVFWGVDAAVAQRGTNVSEPRFLNSALRRVHFSLPHR